MTRIPGKSEVSAEALWPSTAAASRLGVVLCLQEQWA
jgi:hypothetical protein